MCCGISYRNGPGVLRESSGEPPELRGSGCDEKSLGVTVIWNLSDPSTLPVITVPPRTLSYHLLSGKRAKKRPPTRDEEWEGKESNGGDMEWDEGDEWRRRINTQSGWRGRQKWNQSRCALFPHGLSRCYPLRPMEPLGLIPVGKHGQRVGCWLKTVAYLWGIKDYF